MNHGDIADRIEAIIRHTITEFKKQDDSFIDYAMLFSPGKSDTWYIVIYFGSTAELKERIRTGNIYGLHNYIQRLMDGNDLEELNRSILFREGKSPASQEEYDDLFNELNEKSKLLLETAGKSVDVCSGCGHDFDQHQLLGWPVEDGKAPYNGWIACPEENCTCFQTWGANYKGA
jgi:hypothetical protein